MDDPVLRMVGIAKKAGRLELGEEPVGAAARARQAKLIVVASDAADNSVRRASHFAQQGNVPWVQVPFTKGELGQTVGRTSCAMLAMTEVGMASALVDRLAQREPEHFGEAAEALRQKAQKALRRQKEKRQHEKNVQKGRKKPWAAPPKPAAAKAEGGETKSAPAPKKRRPMPRGIVTIKRNKTP